MVAVDSDLVFVCWNTLNEQLSFILPNAFFNFFPSSRIHRWLPILLIIYPNDSVALETVTGGLQTQAKGAILQARLTPRAGNLRVRRISARLLVLVELGEEGTGS